jgi:hypothetical protein
VDVIERRVAWIAVSDAIVLFFATSGGLAYGLAGLGTWELAIVIVVGLVAHGAIEAHQHPNGFGG